MTYKGIVVDGPLKGEIREWSESRFFAVEPPSPTEWLSTIKTGAPSYSLLSSNTVTYYLHQLYLAETLVYIWSVKLHPEKRHVFHSLIDPKYKELIT